MRLRALLLALACARGMLGSPASAGGGEVTLSATGDAGVRVRGRCVLDAPGGRREVRLDEAVAGGSRSRAATSGGRLVVSLR